MKISAIIPAYNAQRWVGRAIESVLNQTEPVSEVIVVDDGSTDGTEHVVRGYGSRITYIRQENGGPARARNTGVRASNGEWLAFLDADDWWKPDKLKIQMAEVTADSSVILVYTALELVTDNGGRALRAAPEPCDLWPQLRYRNPFAVSSVLMHRDVLEQIGGFNERQHGCEDWAAWVRLFPLGKFASVAEPVTCYRIRPNSLSSDGQHMFNDFAKMLEDTLLAGLSGIRRRIWRRKILSYQAFTAGLTARERGDARRERHFLTSSVLQWPSPLWQSKRMLALAITLRNSVGNKDTWSRD
jgi:glycosyltransferase involved in cell wall biosynthesis